MVDYGKKNIYFLGGAGCTICGRCVHSNNFLKNTFACIHVHTHTYIHLVTCLRHSAIVEAQKSVNTLRNNRGCGVYSVPFRAAGGRVVSCRAESSRTAPERFQGNAVVNTVTTQQYSL
jgi:hypothetical protein